MDELKKVERQELAHNGKPPRITEQEATAILAPMFAAYPNTGADKRTFAVYVELLRDIAPDVLKEAVRKAMLACKFLPTIADIREQIPSRMPGPSSHVDPATLPPVPKKFFRLDPDEDRRQRMERLRQTRNWNYDQA